MRKHHNRLFFGQYTHKASFKMPCASWLYPTTDEHLTKIVTDTSAFEGHVFYENMISVKKFKTILIQLASFILENRNKIKFRIQSPVSIFYGNKEIMIEMINEFWEYWTGITTTDPKKVKLLNNNTVVCRRLPLGKYGYQIHVNRKISYKLNENQRDLLYRYLTRNEDNATITNHNLRQWLSGAGAIHYGQEGYFYVKDEKALTPIYMISEHIVDRVVKFVKV